MEREKKRAAIRTQLHRIRDPQFREDCREFVRAIRYLRIRNDELRTLHFISRLQNVLLRQAVVDARYRNRMILNVQRRRRRGNLAGKVSSKGKAPPR